MKLLASALFWWIVFSPLSLGSEAKSDSKLKETKLMKFEKPSPEELKKKLSPIQYEVTQRDGTERPFDNEFWDNKEAGIYVDVVSGEPLFSSLHKFDSGTGWPSFWQPIREGTVKKKRDWKLLLPRTEVRSELGDSHLGHVFEDGPPPTGLRYCINSAALRFVPKAKLSAEGYGEFVASFNDTKVSGSDNSKLEVAVLAGGCFWGMEDLLRKMNGVKSTKVGYTGGNTSSPTYELVKKGSTGHAEAIMVEFDPKVVSYEEIVRYFFQIHDPTTKNRQGNDMGSQYRSAIFYQTPEQKKVAERVIRDLEERKVWQAPIVTELVVANTFTNAEDYHQDYLQKNPGGYTCHWERPKK
jgi:peptide methionine sulfoxide reductase msrA/msrB